MVESEESLDAQVAAAKDFLVQVSAEFLKIFQAIGHDSSVGSSRTCRRCQHYEPEFCATVSVSRERRRALSPLSPWHRAFPPGPVPPIQNRLWRGEQLS